MRVVSVTEALVRAIHDVLASAERRALAVRLRRSVENLSWSKAIASLVERYRVVMRLAVFRGLRPPPAVTDALSG